MSSLNSYPWSPPRVRVEWLIAGTRLALAASAILAVILEPPSHIPPALVFRVLGAYLLYSLAALALVWSPVRFGRGSGLVVHLFDGIIFVLAAGMTDVTSPFFASFAFLVISATLRWQTRGTVLTVLAALTAYAAVTFYGGGLIIQTPLSLDVFVIRTAYLITMAALLGFFGAIQHRSHREIVRLASWPRRIAREPREAISEVIAQSTELLEAPRVVLVWEDPSDGRINLAWQGDPEVSWTEEPEGTYGAFVLPALERWSFQASTAGDENGSVVMLTDTGFRYRRCPPLNEALRARFDMNSVQSWPLAGELVQGRLFALDKPRMRIDDLVFGELVARLAVSRLDTLYLLERLRESAVLEARVNVARDLHDSLLQSQTGAALQLLVARRMLDKDPMVGRERLEDVQRLLEWGELDMRSFIQRLRPEDGSGPHSTLSRLNDRLEVLRRRIARQWDVKVVLRLQGAERLSGQIEEDVYRLAHEAAINAARHADPSVIKIDLIVDHDKLRLGVSDDGQGFSFRGTYDLATLTAMNKGPLTLRERVAAMNGDLILRSQDNGTQLLITVPLAAVAH